MDERSSVLERSFSVEAEIGKKGEDEIEQQLPYLPSARCVVSSNLTMTVPPRMRAGEKGREGW